MLNNDLQVYDACNLNLPPIPSRSRLYSLEPIGIGTPYVESLTSYIARLAEAHCVTPKILLEKKINTLNIQLFGQNKAFGIRQYSGEVNGRGETASKLAFLMEKLTLRKSLRYLTLVSLSEILPRKKLIKTTKAWCPYCYQDYADRNNDIYEPLLWSVNVVKTCPLHNTPLESCCKNCNQKLPPLSSNSRVGFCPKCGQWLGTRVNRNVMQKYTSSNQTNNWNYYVNENIEKLILSSYSWNKPISRDLISQSFKLCINQVTGGNIAAFSRLLGIPKNSVWMWTKGKSVPQIDTLLRICFCLKISILDFLNINKSLSLDISAVNLKNLNVDNHNQKGKKKAEIDTFFLEQSLISILADKNLAPSVTEIAKELGYDRRVLTRKYPDICQKISRKYIANKKRNSQNAIRAYSIEVEAVAKKLYSQGIYPSEVAVSKHLDKPGYFRYKQVRNTLENFQQNLT